MFAQLENFDKTSLKQTSDLTNKRDPKRLLDLAAEAASSNIKTMSLSNANPDVLLVLFKALSRQNNLTDELLQKFVDESDCTFYDVERFELRYNYTLTHNGCKILTKLMPNLIYLDISASSCANEIETYQHLLSRRKLKEIRANPYITNQETIAQLRNFVKVFNWRYSEGFGIFTKES
jgi:hypothetical protein